MKVTHTIIRKLAQVIGVLLIVSFALTFLLDLTPGDPAFALLGDQASPEQVAHIHERLGLDDPFYTRYWNWVSGVVQLDLGTSIRTNQPVRDAILERLPVTAEIVVLSLVMAIIISVPIGIVTAYRVDGPFDRAWQLISSGLVAIPPFVGALLLVYVFSLQLTDTPLFFPPTGWVPLSEGISGNLRTAFLPALTLALNEVPAYSRLLRADMVSTLQSDYVLAARAKGLSTPWILFRHALRPSSFSLVTLAALSTGRLMGGSVIVETLFALPGLGALLVNTIQAKDVVTVQGIVMFIAIVYVVVNSLTDLAYAQLDPRVRSVEGVK